MSLALNARRAVLMPGQWVRNELWRRAKAVPSLDLRFAENKSLVDATTGANLVTFTRASSGTYVGSDGLIKTATTNEPRFDHNPTTGESLGLLVEEQRTNNHLRSEDVSNWGTPSNASVSSNVTTAPDGTFTADKLAENTANAEHFLSAASLSFSYTSGAVYTRSCWLKADGRIYATLYFPATNFPSTGRTAIFNLSAGTVHSTESGVTAAISAFPNGWYRCSITVTATSTGSGHSGGSALRDDNVTAVYTGDGTSGIYLWGAQLEAGAFPTSYIPTTTATVTRSADVASISGSNFSSWYRQDEGTIYTNVKLLTNAIDDRDYGAFVAAGSDTASRIRHDYSTGGGSLAALILFSDAGTQLASPNLSFSATNRKAASAVTTGSVAFSANGQIATGTSAGMPSSVDRLLLGGRNQSSGLNKTIARLAYWPQRLSNSTLQTLTQP